MKNRKLRMGMVGGGRGAFIGGVHRRAAALDGQIELVAGAFPRMRKNRPFRVRISLSIVRGCITPIRKWRRRSLQCPWVRG